MCHTFSPSGHTAHSHVPLFGAFGFVVLDPLFAGESTRLAPHSSKNLMTSPSGIGCFPIFFLTVISHGVYLALRVSRVSWFIDTTKPSIRSGG